MVDRCAVASSSDWPPDRKAMPGTATGTLALSTRSVRSATSSREALRAFLPSMTMLGFSTMPSRLTRASYERVEDGLQHEVGDDLAAFDRVIARLPVHQDFRLDDRNDAGLLAERRVAGKRLGILLHRAPARQHVRNRDHAAPFGETGAEAMIFLQPLAQAVQPFGDRLPRESRPAAWRRRPP